MRWTKTHIFTLRDAPSDAEIVSHQLLVRGGFIKKLAPGIFSFQNLALRSLRKIENILRSVLDEAGYTEILMPMVQPQELWSETGRLGIDELLKFKNRNGHAFCLGATHEEVVTDIVRKDVKSYRDLPKFLYQIQTKYRDEIRPRFGLMRGREFIMKDAYSFDSTKDDAKKSYQVMYEAYRQIFNRLGLQYRIVEADSGNIGGSLTHEFQVLAEAGEDSLMYCDTCDFAANLEVAPCVFSGVAAAPSSAVLENFSTPGLRSIRDLAVSLKVKESELIKTLFFADDHQKPFAVLLRGSDELNPIKLKNQLGLKTAPLLLKDDEVLAVTGANPGSCGPVGLKIPIYIDQEVLAFSSMVTGANKDDFHVRNVVRGRDFKEEKALDVRMAVEGDLCPRCKNGKYKSARGIEVGHVFYLGTKYSVAMSATHLNAQGENVPAEMGCYGIGVTRTMQAAIEQNHDADGMIWPVPIAPFEVHICLLDPQDPQALEVASALERDLLSAGFDCLTDDREERPGVKFKDADLLGFPLRVNIGKKGLAAGEIEIVERKGKKLQKIPIAGASDFVISWLKQKQNSEGKS